MNMQEDRLHPMVILSGIAVGMTIYMPFGNWIFGTEYTEYFWRLAHAIFVASVVLWLHRDRSKTFLKSRNR